MGDSVDLFHALQHVKYARSSLNAWTLRFDVSNIEASEDMVRYDIQQLDNVETRIKLLLRAINDGEV